MRALLLLALVACSPASSPKSDAGWRQVSAPATFDAGSGGK
jgi:hypothetical protein